ncbi:MAG TPA: hypothetical protein ENG87_02390 [Candidatus Pacearchaeota archaeon]|nr:transmembrane exosortase [archaeon BMS3Abin17]HDK42204.1 hypothetical protein [Candidatus Pacearchaeota archaeon]HDZ61459.1 hypothetical protein [Candidatus Pacearchaeota archaeon]
MEKGFRQLLIKTGIFVGLFVLFSLIIGQKIVASELLSGFKIFIYGGLGKILLFSILGFIILYRERLVKLRWGKTSPLFLLLSFILLALFYIVELNITNISISALNIILVQALFLSVFISLLIGVFGLNFIKDFAKQFRKELGYFLIFGAVVYSLMYQVWKLWPYLSLVVLEITHFLLNLISNNVYLIGESTLILEGFSAQIAEACSGVYSIFIFTALYLFIILLDWNKIDKLKAAIVFIPAVIGAFFMNILRVFLLFIFGGYISKTLALGLYHSYVGMVFFMIYFIIFWVLFYDRIKKPEYRKTESKSKIFVNKIMSDSLYRNSIYLMSSTLVMAVLGFAFWMMIARMFTTYEVGLATTIISVMGLITGLSVLGLNVGLIRYLPKAKEKNKKINTSLTLVGIVSIIVASLFLLGLGKFSPSLLFIQENMIMSFSFIIFMIISGFGSITDSVFIAYRNTKYILAKNTIFSVMKLILPFAFISLGAYGIFSSWMISMMIAISFSFFILIRKYGFKPKVVFYDSIIRKIGKYSFGNYIAGFIGSLPLMILPLMITNMISPETTAYYYMAMMIAGLLFVIPSATTQSLFAEGSYNEDKLKQQIKKSIKIIALLMVPGILITMFFGQYILLAFGKEYSTEGFRFLQIIAFSGIFISITKVYESVLRVKKQIKKIAYVNTTVAIISISLAYALMNKGLLGVGIAWITSWGIVSLIYVVFVRVKKR